MKKVYYKIHITLTTGATYHYGQVKWIKIQNKTLSIKMNNGMYIKIPEELIKFPITIGEKGVIK